MNLVFWQSMSIVLVLAVGLPLAIISARSSIHEKKEAQRKHHKAKEHTAH
ncbi:hypothetical protein [Acidithiobacillus ferrivorans]|jgi:hypothetical protein|uniref:Uncharacterized protein n=1 Tax=Acidithiobacillus ferrivorans TaxID=160808 RepID=A0A7T5BG46_9PROT|nr:hypothetical protein [Acidithiobacillus ferrivorans]QQD71981.1 hypothetical protein H2515_11160 [Acidithiobacillus ferrivorans]